MDSLQHAIDKHSQELLPLVVRIFVFIYSLLAASHFLLLSDELVTPMTTTAGMTVLAGISVYFLLGNSVVQTHSEFVLVFLLLLMGVNSVAHMSLGGDIKQTTNFIFVMSISGYVLPGYRTFFPTLLLLFASWALVVVTSVSWDADTTHFGFEILLGMVFAIFLNSLRRNQLKQTVELEQAVSQLEASQNQLSTGQALLQDLMDKIPAGIIVRDKETRILYINAAARTALGFGDRDVIGQMVGEGNLNLVSEKGEPLGIEGSPVSLVKSGEVIRNHMLGVRLPSGETNWGLVNAFPLTIEMSGDEVFVIAFSDITERVRAEEQLQKSEMRARTILDSVEEGVISINREGFVTLFNPRAEELTGISESEALGKPLDTVFNYQDAEHTLEEGFQVIREGQLTRSTGDEISVELLVSELLDGDDLTGWIYTFRDVGEQIRLEQERATLDKMNSVGVLAGGIAHDFNNLLTAIYGNMTLAETLIDKPEEALTYINRSSESIQLATNLTKQLLTFATGSDPVRDVVDVELLVREATGFSLSGSSIAVEYEVEEDVDAVEVDDGQMRQAISNIVLNAKQAMDDQGRITIRIANYLRGAESPERFVQVQVSDGGPGISEDVVSRIFDPYFTTKETGTGLGLATTHSIVVKHGGSIHVESELGKGTTFSMLLPSAGTISEREIKVPTSGNEEASNLHILVMDDEDVVLQTIIRLLEHLGHQATGTRDGEEAIAAYKSRHSAGPGYDLVIMDLTVAGGMGGREAAAEIIAIDPEARLVVSSGYSAGAEMARYEDYGFCARLEKPFRAADLKALITEVMSRSD